MSRQLSPTLAGWLAAAAGLIKAGCRCPLHSLHSAASLPECRVPEIPLMQCSAMKGFNLHADDFQARDRLEVVLHGVAGRFWEAERPQELVGHFWNSEKGDWIEN